MSHYSEEWLAERLAKSGQVKAAKSTVPTVGPDSKRQVRARGQAPRHRPGVMNKTEAEYAGMLEVRKLAGEVKDYWFEEVTFRLADDCRYTVDFFVLMSDLTIECHEVKAEWSDGQKMKDDARVKLKVAAQRYPFKFVLATKLSKKSGGGWNIRQFN